MPYRVPTILDLSEAERTELESWARRKTAQALALRACIVLQAAAGLSNSAIATELGIAKHTVGKWRERFARLRTDGLLDEPRPVPVATAPGPFADGQHPHRRPRLRYGTGSPRGPQQGIGADLHGQTRRQPRADLAADGEAQMPLEVVQPPCPAGGRRCGIGQSLGEGQARTVRLQAAETPSLNVQPDWLPQPGRVIEYAVVPAVDAPGRLAAGRAGCPGLTRGDDDSEVFGGGQDPLDQRPSWNERKRTLRQQPDFRGEERTPVMYSVRPGTTTRGTGSAGETNFVQH
ncbi:helix-turn-helix domain-containing protein [Paracraurococcus sp. LOR1-02]|uniref:Helix-turn-helix domain-containing protein n=1 Tax=Paracraurococcus lichenis TaxID=3064888 RepID=A0ABT9E5Q3_9PROT|nr:helix-turn-helix domain-containing protein [Paracraurococcus sp. LOR1-02]MDO9711502.1 helix-turn-helix domain-containing protein [Paracraurococcus sp. LOR1-02]